MYRHYIVSIVSDLCTKSVKSIMSLRCGFFSLFLLHIPLALSPSVSIRSFLITLLAIGWFPAWAIYLEIKLALLFYLAPQQIIITIAAGSHHNKWICITFANVLKWSCTRFGSCSWYFIFFFTSLSILLFLYLSIDHSFLLILCLFYPSLSLSLRRKKKSL